MATIGIDFDGVLFPSHQYTSRTEIEGPPTPGATDFVRDLLDRGDKVFILTSRLADAAPHQRKAFEFRLSAWLAAYFGQSAAYMIQATEVKHPADYYIDDKAVCFRGEWPLPATFPRGGFRGTINDFDAQAHAVMAEGIA